MVWGRLGAGCALIGILAIAIAVFMVGDASAITDATAPSLTLPASATTNATSSQGATVAFIAVATDDIQPTSITCAPASGSLFPVGTTNVTCVAADAAGHTATASFSVTVVGAAEQLAQLRTAVLAAGLPRGTQTALLAHLDAAQRAIDDGKQKQACQQLDQFSDAPADLARLANEVGAAIDCIASDARPVLLGPRANVTATTAPGAATATVRFTGPSSSVSCTPTSPAAVGVGTSNVTCTATNFAGSVTTSFLVTVVDQEAPSLTVPADIVATAPPGSSSAVVTYVVTAADNAGIRSTLCAPPSGSAFSGGVTTVSCTATDNSGNTTTRTFKITVNFAISGRIRDLATGLPIEGVVAEVFDTTGTVRVGLTTSRTDGTYSVVVVPGVYRVLFNGDLAAPYTRVWWNQRPDFGDDIVVAGSVGGIDAALAAGVVVHGRVTDESTGSGVANVAVSAVDPAAPCCRSISNASTDASGNYQLVVQSGTVVKVQFVAGSSPRYMVEWWNNKRNFNEATSFTVTGETFGIDAALTPAVLLTGKVTDELSGFGIGSIAVVVTDSTTPCCPFGDITVGVTAGDGTYGVLVPRARPIKIQFVPFGTADPQYIAEWFDNQPDWDHATVRSFNADTTGIDAALIKGVFIRGHVTRLDNGAPIERIHVNVNEGVGPCCQFVAGTRTESSGDYAVLVRPGTYKVIFYSDVADPPTDGHVYLEQWWQGVRFFESATPLTISGDTPGINAALTQAVVIRGRVTDSAGTVPVVGLNVSAQDAIVPCCRFVAGAQTDALGNYTLFVPLGASLKVEFGVFGDPPPGIHYIGEWWNDKASFEIADPIVANADRLGIDARLARGATVSGRVTDITGQPLVGAVVNANDATMPCCRFLAAAQTDALGNYQLIVSPGSRVRVFFIDPAHPRLMPQWWNDKPFFDGADVVDVTGDVGGIDARLRPGVLINGRVTDATGTIPVGALNVSAHDASLPCCRFVAGTQTDALGNYALFVPLGASVKVEFGVFGGSPPGTRYIGEWWNDKPTFEQGDAIAASGDVSGIDARLVRGFLVSGRVTERGTGIPLSGIRVQPFDALGPSPHPPFGQAVATDALGNYTLVLPQGPYQFYFFESPIGSPPHIPQWWVDSPSEEFALVLGVGQDSSGIDAALRRGVYISGHVTDPTGLVPVSDVQVTALDALLSCGCQVVSSATTNATGNYSLLVASGFQVKIRFAAPSGTPFADQWWNNKPSFDNADVIDASTDRSGIDARFGVSFLVSGHVSERGTGIALSAIRVNAIDATVPCCPQPTGSTATDTFGNYALTLPAGSYKLVFFQSPLGDHPHYVQWWHDRTFSSEADVLVVSGPTPGINQELPIAVWISGRVTDSTGTIPVVGMQVSAQNAAFPCCRFVDGAQTDAAGNYRFIAPIGTGLKIEFGVFGGSPPGTHYFGEWWNDKLTFDTADVLLANADRSGVDARLETASAGSVSGHVTDRATGLPIENVDVTAYDALVPCCARLGSARTNATGDYTLTLPGAATVKLNFQPMNSGPAYVARWWRDQPDFGPADVIVVRGPVANIDQALDAGYLIRGRVTDAASGAGLANVSVLAQPNFSCCFSGTQTGPDGRYSLIVNAATYRISFFPPFGSDYLEQWWNGKPGYTTADLITIPSSSIDLNAIDAALIHGIPVSGRVTAPGGIVGVGQVAVVATLDDPAVPCCANYSTQTDASGNYTIYVRAGMYRLNFQPPNTTDYVLEYWDDQPDFQSATLLDVTGPTFNIDAELETGFRISGRVTDALGGAGLQNAVVVFSSEPCCSSPGIQGTEPDGTYSFVVRPGSYKVGFFPPFGTDFVSQYWNNKPNSETADVLLVNAARPNIDAVLSHGVLLSGRVTEASDPTRGIAGVNVSVGLSTNNLWVAGAATQADGTYSVFVAPGSYVLYFDPFLSGDFVAEFWNDKPEFATADVITVTGPPIANLDASLARALSISGRVTNDAGDPIPGIIVNVDTSTEPVRFVMSAVTDADGRYSAKVPAGSYKVLFFPGAGVPYLQEWWRERTTFETADVIDLSSTSVANVDGVLTRGVLITGHVTASGSGAALDGATVYVYDAAKPCCVFVALRGTGPDGAYSMTVPPGSYWVEFVMPGYQGQFWNAKPDLATADILVGAVDHLNIDAAMMPASP